MKKKIAMVLFQSLLFVININGQNLEWASTIGGYSSQSTTDVAGNLIVAGQFEQGVDFDPGIDTALLGAWGGNHDIFVAKYDVNGNYLWAISIRGLAHEFISSITTDKSSNILVTGSFEYEVDFDPGPDTAYLEPLSWGYAMFIAKYDSNGNYIWAISIDTVVGTSITTNGCSDIFATGYSSEGIYFAKYDADGNPIWAKNTSYFSDSVTYSSRSVSIAVDNSNNVLITGYFSDTVDFDPGSGIAMLISDSLSDIFFAKYDANGDYMWAKSIGVSWYGDAKSIISDASGDVLITGAFYGTADFDPDTGVANLTSKGYSDIFLAKYDANGNYLWANSMGGASPLWGEKGYGIAVDAGGEIYVTGSFLDTADFDPGLETANLISIQEQDVFIAKYDLDGNYIWAKSIGSLYNDAGYSISIDNTGNLLTTGTFQNSADFDLDSGIFYVTANGPGIYLAKYSQDDFTSTKGIVYLRDIEINVYPNPSNGRITIEIDNPYRGKAELKVMNILGEFVYQEHFEQSETQRMVNLSYIVPGIYFVQLETQDGVDLKKIIIQ